MRDEDSISRGSVRLLVSRTSAASAAFLAYLILARTLDPSGRGTVAFVMTAAFVLASLSSLGFDQATAVFTARRSTDRPALLSNALAVSLASSAVVGSAFAAILLLSPSLRPTGVGAVELVALVAGNIAIRSATTAMAFLSGAARFFGYAVAIALPPAVLVVLLAVVALGSTITTRTACATWACAQIAGALVAVVFSAHVVRPGRLSAPLMRTSLLFGLRAWSGSLASLLTARTDQVLMGFIATESALGYYAVAVNASDVTMYLPAATAVALTPAVARAAPTQRVATSVRVFRVLLLLTGSVVVLGAVCAPLIPLVFGAAYEPSVSPYLILLPGAIGFVPLAVFTNALVASSAPGRSSFGPVVAFTVGIALDILLIPRYAASGAAMAATVALFCGGAVSILVYSRVVNLPARALMPRFADLSALRSLWPRSRGMSRQ